MISCWTHSGRNKRTTTEVMNNNNNSWSINWDCFISKVEKDASLKHLNIKKMSLNLCFKIKMDYVGFLNNWMIFLNKLKCGALVLWLVLERFITKDNCPQSKVIFHVYIWFLWKQVSSAAGSGTHSNWGQRPTSCVYLCLGSCVCAVSLICFSLRPF